MIRTTYGNRVKSARSKRKELVETSETLAFDSLTKGQTNLLLWANALDFVNKHITIPQEQIDAAIKSYEQVAEHLVKELEWQSEDIEILPQGSASTKTLIRSPDASKFDIDAVCKVNISRIDALKPMNFFESIGKSLKKFEPAAKKRCWRIEFENRRFYIEFTPSVPLSQIPSNILGSVRYKPFNTYHATALAVVDTPSKEWKTSNPEGFYSWVNEQAKKSIIVHRATERMVYAADSITPVPDQEVPLSDTLRIAIRLFKRHRDMVVRRGSLDGEYKPISVIIVTLLTQCYEGMADNNDIYNDPIQLLVDLAELLPGMIEERNGEYWVANPTVDGENFAERWNQDSGARKNAFDIWCNLLIDDLHSILAEDDEKVISDRVRYIFGCVGSNTPDTTPGSGLTSNTPEHSYKPPPTKGLA